MPGSDGGWVKAGVCKAENERAGAGRTIPLAQHAPSVPAAPTQGHHKKQLYCYLQDSNSLGEDIKGENTRL